MRSLRSVIGPALCAVAACVFAAPTLLLPADSPSLPKAVLLVGGTVLLTLGAIGIRREGVTRARAPRPDEAPVIEQ